MQKRKHFQKMGEYTLSLSLGNYPIHGKQFPGNSVILRFDFGTILVCPNVATNRKGNVKLYVYSVSDQKWYVLPIRNKYTRIMCDFYKRETYTHANYEAMMKHDRKRKTGGSGKRLTPFCGHVTDYECTKNPFHDFRRVYV